MSTLPRLARSLFDDAAVFPPGSAALTDAVPAHGRHTHAPYADAVGPLVLSAQALSELPDLLGPDGLDLAVTLPKGPRQLPGVIAVAAGMPVRLRALEIAVPSEQPPTSFFAALERAFNGVDGDLPAGTEVCIEVPRDARREEVLSGCQAGRYRAKFRTGGIEAALHPGEAELAAAIRATVTAGVPFKATAGLHHAVRDTEPRTGFEQHGFLNIVLATDAALHRDAGPEELRDVLAERDSTVVAAEVGELDDTRVSAVRDHFTSFGTCSIIEPLSELVALGLVPDSILGEEGVTS